MIHDTTGNLLPAQPGLSIVDRVQPEISSINSPSGTGPFNDLNNLTINITFSESVTLTGTAVLDLNTGGTAICTGPVSSTILSFIYNIGVGDEVAELDAVSPLDLGAGTIVDTNSNSLILTVPTGASSGSLAVNNTIEIDAVAPTVNVGGDLFENSAASVVATADDGTGSGIASYAWTKVSGLGIVTFTPSNAVSTTISADTNDSYVLRLTVTDFAGNNSSDDLVMVWDTVNPSVNVGGDLIEGSTFGVTASASDVGGSGIETFLWTKESGPGTITFTDSGSATTDISASAEGAYTIRLTVTDYAGNSSFDELNLLWDTADPTVDVGGDLVERTTVGVTATASDGGGIDTYLWTKESGPGTVTFSAAGAITTNITPGTDGIYTIRLTVTDYAGNSSFDELILEWDTTPPTINTGADIFLNGSGSITATASDGGSGLNNATRQWSHQSGGSYTVVFSAETSSTTDISVPTAPADTSEFYTIQFSVFDLAGNEGTDSLLMKWDLLKPTLQSVILADSSPTTPGVGNGDTMTFTFDEPIDQSSISGFSTDDNPENQIMKLGTINTGAGGTYGSGFNSSNDDAVLSTGGNSVIITLANLEGADATNTPPSGDFTNLTSLTDLAGNSANATSCTITGSFDATAPTASVSTSPVSMPLLSGDIVITITYNEPMDEDAIDEPTITPTFDSADAGLSATVKTAGFWNGSGDVYEIEYTVGNTGSIACTLTFTITAAKDITGNAQIPISKDVVLGP